MSGSAAPSALALDGGPPVRRSPWPAWPHFDEDEIRAAADVLRSGKVNYWTGERGRAFERTFAAYCGAPFGIAVANGTVALEACLHALDLGHDDEVVVPARTFAATGASVVRMGARPVFADVDPDSGCLDVPSLHAACTARTRAVIVVHLGGWPADMPALTAFGRAQGIAVIEDCAQAHGAAIAGRRVGAWGDLAAFSFCQDKIMTTGGEGGMILCRDEALWRRAWAYKDHGKAWSAVYEREHPPGFRWLHESIGTNARMTEMQAAIGEVQLGKLDAWVHTRRSHARRLAAALASCAGLRVPVPAADVHDAAYRLYAYLRPGALRPGWTRDRVMEAIEAEGVPCKVGSCGEIYLERAFEPYRPATRLPVARALAEQSLCFLVHPTMSADDVDDIATAVHKVLAHAAVESATA